MTQTESEAQQSGSADFDDSKVVNVVELMAAVLEDSPSNRLMMVQMSGQATSSSATNMCSIQLLTPSFTRLAVACRCTMQTCPVYSPLDFWTLWTVLPTPQPTWGVVAECSTDHPVCHVVA